MPSTARAIPVIRLLTLRLVKLSNPTTHGEIAAELFLSANTVKTHINRIFAKTASRDRSAAALYARRHGLD